MGQAPYGHDAKYGGSQKEPTKWLTNPSALRTSSDTGCGGQGGQGNRPEGGEHIPVQGQHTLMTAVYPDKMPNTTLNGCRASWWRAAG